MTQRPADPKLAAWADEVEAAGWSAALFDVDWALQWVSPELRYFLGAAPDEDLGFGKHAVEVLLSDKWLGTVHPDSHPAMFTKFGPYFVDQITQPPLRDAVPQELVAFFAQMEPEEPPPVATTSFLYLNPREGRGLPDYEVDSMYIRLHDKDGAVAAWLALYQIGVKPHLLSLLARGDEQMYERMARLVDPGHREAAILFCDLAHSGELSKRLPSAEYFDHVRRLWMGIDAAFAEHCGIIGKHAGDGASGFFLVDDLGGPSEAAAAAIATARRVHEVAADVFADLSDSPDLMKVGVHWGGSLYMGQLVPGGRLEVTALGDEVNEAARIEEVTPAGATTASKQLVEHLTDEHADKLGLDVRRIRYEMLASVAPEGGKALRDAGMLAITKV